MISQQAHATLTGIGVLLIVGALLAAACVMRRNERSALAIASLCWAAQVQDLFSAKPLADVLQSQGVAAGPVFSLQLYDQSLAFYLGRPVLLWRPRACRCARLPMCTGG
jgi:hypothetical protein